VIGGGVTSSDSRREYFSRQVFLRASVIGQSLPRLQRRRRGKTGCFSGRASGMPFAELSVNPVPEFGMPVSFAGFSQSSAFPTQTTSTALTAKPAATQSAEQKFLEYANMSPAERLHAQVLAELGLTEDQFKAMSPADRQKTEDKIREMIKQQVANGTDKRTGMITDKSV